jgi:CDP-diacylglycerol--serine O-phosphatidyltransferase
MVLPVVVLVVLFVALLISFPWEVLTVGTVLYVGSLPFGAASYRRQEREAAIARAERREAAAHHHHPAQAAEPEAAHPDRPAPAEPERPARLN